jgi:dTDP-4-amino-4,6-dideoxygalactose transaminase/predicted dehydrogenase
MAPRPETPSILDHELSDREIRVAVVGLGYWGPNVLRAAYDAEGVQVVAGCDSDPDALARQARRYELLRLVSHVDEVLEDEAVDAVMLATPVSTHYELARRTLLAGKHVLVEKPLASTVTEARELIGLADEKHLVLMPGHTFVYSPPVVAVKRMLDAGDLGRIHFVTSTRVNLGIHQRDISVVRDLAPHDFSILLHWLGAPSAARAVGRDAVVPGVVDVSFIDLVYDDGCVAHVDLSWLAPTKLRQTLVVGDRKMVVYDDTSPEQMRVFDRGVDFIEPRTFGEFQLSYRAGDVLSPHLPPDEPLRLEIEDFAQAIRSRGRPRSDADFGLEVVRMVVAAETSLNEDGRTVALDDAETAAPPPPPARDPGAAPRRPRISSTPERPEVVPLVDVKRSLSPLRPALKDRLELLAREGDFTLGRELAAFEREFAGYCGTKGCVGVSDGTAALALALAALDVGPGDEVVTTPATFIGTVEAILATGARPVFADIDPATRCISPQAVADAIRPATRAVVPVHLYGRPAPLREIRALCSAAGVPVLEDAAQAHGARLGSRRAGALGTAAAFSFYPTKNLGALGDAGAVVSDDPDLLAVVRSLRDHGAADQDRQLHVSDGVTARLDNLQAAFLRVKLPLLDEWNAQRRRAAQLYRELLEDAPLTLPPDDPPAGQQVYHLFVVEVEQRDAVKRAMLMQGIETGVYYQRPVHLQPVWRERGYGPGDFPEAESLAERALALPMFPGISDAEIRRVSEALRIAVETPARLTAGTLS